MVALSVSFIVLVIEPHSFPVFDDPVELIPEVLSLNVRSSLQL